MTGETRKQEWASSWTLPMTAMLGMTGGAIFAFSSGVFMGPMIAAFGWTKTQFSAAFTLQMVCGLFLMPFLGRMVDRLGARRIALVGVVIYVAALSLLGTVNGSVAQWWGLCIFLAICQATISQPVWMTAVVARFQASRGLAVAVSLAGLGLGSFMWPIASAFYIRHLGWRAAFPAMGLSWGVVALPLVALFLIDPRKPSGAAAAKSSAPPIRADLLSGTFVSLAVAGGLFACSYYGLVVHFVSMLHGGGISVTTAAGLAGLVGVFSVMGRITTGYLLDHISPRVIGGIVFLLPIGVAWLLWIGSGSIALSAAAAALLGIASGSELDIVTFVVARHVRAEGFASVYAVMMAILSLSASIGPTLAAALFDKWHSYAPFQLAVVPMAIIGSVLVASVRDRPPRAPHGH